jgi:hypothetical protein
VLRIADNVEALDMRELLAEATGGDIGRIMQRLYEGMRKRLAGTLSDAQKDQCIEDARPMMEILDIFSVLSNLRLQ